MGRIQNLWMGYELTNTEKKQLTDLTLKEFEKSPKNRVTPRQLILEIPTWVRRKFNEYERTAGY